MSDSDDGFFFSQGMAPEPSIERKRMMDRFVQEYLRDYDAVAACLRMGYNKTAAEGFASQFMESPHVQRGIKDGEDAEKEDDDDHEAKKRKIIAGLNREANYFGPGSSQGARVAALAQLAKINGLESSKVEHSHKGGVMLVPSTATNVDTWEAMAMPNQEGLHHDNASRH